MFHIGLFIKITEKLDEKIEVRLILGQSHYSL